MYSLNVKKKHNIVELRLNTYYYILNKYTLDENWNLYTPKLHCK